MKKNLHLLFRITMLIFFAMNSFSTFSSVITGNMNPMSFSPGSVNQAIYDLDNNGQFDFKVNIVYLGSSNYTLVFKGLNGAKFETDGSLELIGYNEGTPLGGNTYQDSGYVKSLFFPEYTVKYIGLTFKINGVSHCAYLGARSTSYYQGFFDLWAFGYETNSSICISANASAALDKTGNLSDLKVSPNPSKSKFEIDLDGKSQNLKFNILNALGQEIPLQFSKNNNTITFSINEPSGIYFLLIEDGEKREVLRLIKD